MSEVLTLTRPDNRTASHATITLGDVFPGQDMAEQPRKALVRVYVGDRFREITMATKRPWCFDQHLPYGQGADRFIAIWQTIKAAGIPVVPTLRKVSSDQVVMTDLTRDGSMVFGKHQAHWPELLPNDPASWEIYKNLFRIPRQDIAESMQTIADRATSNQIALPRDQGIDIVVHPTGKWHLIALDIGNSRIRQDRPSEIQEVNNVRAGEFMRTIRFLRRQFRQRPDSYRFFDTDYQSDPWFPPK